MPGRQRRDLLPAPAWVISGQACQLVEQPRRGEDFQEPLHLAGADLPRRDDEVESVGGKRDEGQIIDKGGRPSSRFTSRRPPSATSFTLEIRPTSSGRSASPSRHEQNPITSPPSGSSSPAGPILYLLSGPRRCVPAICTSPSAASLSASWLGHGHQLNATGGSSSLCGDSRSGSAGSQPVATKVGRGGPTGRTFLRRRARSSGALA